MQILYDIKFIQKQITRIRVSCFAYATMFNSLKTIHFTIVSSDEYKTVESNYTSS